MSVASTLNKIKNSVLNKLSGDMTNVFIITTIVGYLASAAGQLYGINTNNKLEPDKKKFLNFQELADCVINIFAYFTVTKGLTKATKFLASSGKFLPQSIVDKCNLCMIDLKKVKNIGKEMNQRLNKISITQNAFKDHNIKVTSDITSKMAEEAKNLTALKSEYVPYESGMSMIGTISGGLLSADIFAPILRNKYASIKQKQEQPTISYYQYSPTYKSNNMKV